MEQIQMKQVMHKTSSLFEYGAAKLVLRIYISRIDFSHLNYMIIRGLKLKKKTTK